MKKISPPDPLKPMADDWVDADGSCPPGKHIWEPIRNDSGQRALRARILEGAASPPAGMADADYFERLRRQIRGAGR